MSNLALKSGEAQFFGDDEDPMFASEFAQERLTDATEVFTVAFETGREWESEETDDGGFTIRTKPDPKLLVYDTAGGKVFAIAANTLDPMVYVAIRASHTNHIGLVERLVESIDDGYDGIVQIAGIESLAGYAHLADAAESATDRLVPE